MEYFQDVPENEKTVEAAWQYGLYDAMLNGHVPLRNIPKLMPTCARVYLSSVATDSECEREYLITNIYIKLREYCRAAHNIEFQMVDLRSGLDRQSQHLLPSVNQVREFEIKQCQATSTGPCFVALLGQRYCNEAIPPLSIPSNKHSAQREALLANNVDIRILERHYRLDENCQPAQFLLQPHLNDVDKWVETERKLSEMLMLAARFLDDSDWFNPPSDLQIEIGTGLFNVEKQKFRDDNCLLFRKKITNIEECLERKRASKFIDLYPATNEVDKAANSAMVNLRQTVESSVSPNNIFDFNIEWAEPAGIDSKVHKDYLISFGNTLFEQIRRHVDVCMIEWAHYPNNELYTEIQQHWLCTRSNLEHFYEQGQYLQAIENYVGSQSHAPIFVHGVNGCGKSSILSCIASNACEKSSSLRVILRHLGHTPASCDIQQLLLSLIEQLCHVMGMSYVAPKTFLEAKLRFRNILEKGYCNCTLLLVIDGLDCLSTEGYDQIDWLPMKLSPNIKMVVSLRDLDPKNTLEKIQKKYRDSSCFLQVENMLPEICEWMLKKRLQETNRLVTSKQWSRISKGLHESPYPLYVELVFQQVIKWRSYDAPVLPHTVDGVIAKLLDILEDTHGYLATSHTLSLLSSSMYGLSEAELEDILSIDDELLSVFASPDTHSVLRVPCAVWSKLKLDLYPYLSVWKVDNVNLITWKYPQISKAVQKKYMSSEAFSRKIHNLVADFFLGKWSGIVRKPNKLVNDKQTKVISYSTVVRGSSHRNVISQPLVISGHGTQARVNVRKLNELAHHLAKANEIEDLKKEVLFNYDWLHTKLSAMPMSRLLADFDIYSDAEISLVRQALSDIKIEFDPDTLGMELSGRLMVYYSQHPNIKSLIDQCDLQSLQRCSAVPKLQLYQTPGSLLQHQFEERLHVTPTLQLSMVSKPDATYFVVKEEKWNYALLYNVSSHETTRLFGLPGEGLLYVTPNQEKIVTKRENRIESYQVDSQQLEFSVDTDKGSISCSAISDSYFVFSIKQKTGPYVVDLLYPSLVHRLKHHSTALAVSHDGEVMVCNDGQCLHVYELPLMTRHCSIPTDDTASKILFLSNSDTFIVLSSSHYVTMYSVSRYKKKASVSVILQEPSIVDMHLSADKSQLLIHSKKYMRVVDTATLTAQYTITDLSHSTSSHDIVSAYFTCDGQKVIAARERTIGIFDSSNGSVIRHAEVPFPCDVWSFLACPKLNKAVSVLENGIINVWDIDMARSVAKHKNNFYPGEVSSFSVSRDGSKMAVSNVDYPDAKVIDCSTGNVVHRLYDSFAAGSQPLSVIISPCAQFVVTRCSNETEGTVPWPRLRSDYVWSAVANRVTHFFVNCYSVTFSSDDEVVVALSCSSFSPSDPSNKLFIALCYNLKGEDVDEHKVTLPDGDVIGEPLVYSKKNWLVCLIQPCIKTKFSGMVMEQRVDNVQLYLFDTFTSSAKDRTAVNCFDLTGEKTFFMNMRETNVEYQLLLMYSRDKLPPYKDDYTVDVGYPMKKGFLLYDLLTRSVLHHISDYLVPTIPTDQLLFSKYLTYTVHDFKVYSGKTGQLLSTLELNFSPSDCISPVLLLDGNYMAVVTECLSAIRIVNTRNGAEKSHFLLHGRAVELKVGEDDRTLYVSTADGRVLVVVVVMELCDHMTMLVRNLPSRQAVK